MISSPTSRTNESILASGTRSWNASWYVGFHAQYLAADLTQAAHDVKQAAFYGYDQVVGAAGYGHPKYDTDVQLLLWRTYYRTTISVPAPPPNAPSALTGTVVSAVATDLSWTNNTSIATAEEANRMAMQRPEEERDGIMTHALSNARARLPPARGSRPSPKNP